jgi:hypothetical protein
MTSRSWPNGDAEERDDVAALFGVERGRLLELLGELLPGDWHRPSPCPGWSVFDLCGHLVGDDLGWLARQRDDHHGTVPPEAVDQVEGGIARWLDDLQDQWVHSARRLGPAWSQTFWPGPARRSSTRWSARTRPASMGRSRGHAPGPYRCGWTSSVKSPSSGSTSCGPRRGCCCQMCPGSPAERLSTRASSSRPCAPPGPGVQPPRRRSYWRAPSAAPLCKVTSAEPQGLKKATDECVQERRSF